MENFTPAPPIPTPDTLPQLRALGHKVGYFQRCLTDHDIEIVTRIKDTNKTNPLWGARLNSEIVTFRSVMSSDAGYETFRAVGDKAWTKTRLRDAGINTPMGTLVNKERLHESFEAAAQVGLPCVVKPKAGSHGKGVTLNVNTFHDFKRAVDQLDREVIVEKEITGQDYRVVTIGGKVVAGTLRKPANVVGDGKRTVTQLVEEKNQQRAANPSLCRNLINIDDESTALLREQGLLASDTPERGQTIRLKRVANIGSGGDSIDVTDLIHPGFADICARIPALFNSPEILGIDILASDISLPPDNQDWVVLELNANPDIDIHRWPHKGTRRDIGSLLVRHYFPHAEKATPKSVELTFKQSKNDEKFRSSLRSRAIEFGVWGTGFVTNEEYFLRLEGTTAALDRLTNWILANGSTARFTATAPSPESDPVKQLTIRPLEM